MNIPDLQENISRLKKELNICILAHAYQKEEIWEVADYVGDSFGLSQQAAKSDAQTVIMCGVLFMAETVKILSPHKKVLLANATATCPMADQMDRELIAQLKQDMYPDHALVCYINTSTSLKTICDACVTSSSAVRIIRNLDQDKILFVPDCNLGNWVAQQVPEKSLQFVHGGCPTHLRISTKDVAAMRRLHPKAPLLVHPECHPSVVKEADFVGSTTEIMSRARHGQEEEYIIGTENSIVEHLQYRCPEKLFFPLSKECVCHNMQVTTLMDVYNCLIGRGGKDIQLSADDLAGARRCLDEMLRLGSK